MGIESKNRLGTDGQCTLYSFWIDSPFRPPFILNSPPKPWWMWDNGGLIMFNMGEGISQMLIGTLLEQKIDQQLCSAQTPKHGAFANNPILAISLTNCRDAFFHGMTGVAQALCWPSGKTYGSGKSSIFFDDFWMIYGWFSLQTSKFCSLFFSRHATNRLWVPLLIPSRHHSFH